jgi:beta-fructofuranosidase
LDGCAFYAAKSASDGKRRFLFGWNPTRRGEKDDGPWDWGGNLVVHELVQQADGQLGVRIPASVSKAFSRPAPTLAMMSAGNVKQGTGTLILDAKRSFAARALGTQPPLCKISARAKFDADTRELGLMFRASSDLDNGYYVRLEPHAQRLVFDMWPRRLELSHMVELERPLDLRGTGAADITVILDRNMGVAYINDEVAMNFRAYDLPEGTWGFFATGGSVTFSEISVSTLS